MESKEAITKALSQLIFRESKAEVAFKAALQKVVLTALHPVRQYQNNEDLDALEVAMREYKNARSSRSDFFMDTIGVLTNEEYQVMMNKADNDGKAEGANILNEQKRYE